MALVQKFDSDLYGSLTIHKDNEGREFFRAIDVCYALKHSNPSQALSRLIDAEYIFQIDDGTNRSGKVNYLSEPGLYQLIFASKSVAAKEFQRWVFEEVLPKLRASGYYVMPTATSEQLEAANQAIALLQAENKNLKANHTLNVITADQFFKAIKFSASLMVRQQVVGFMVEQPLSKRAIKQDFTLAKGSYLFNLKTTQAQSYIFAQLFDIWQKENSTFNFDTQALEKLIS